MREERGLHASGRRLVAGGSQDRGGGGGILGRMPLPFPGAFHGRPLVQKKVTACWPWRGRLLPGTRSGPPRKRVPNASSTLPSCWKPLPLPMWERPSGTPHLPGKAVVPTRPLWGLSELCGSQGWWGVADTANNAVPAWVHVAREIRGVLLGFVFSVLRREESESLRFSKASGRQHPLTGIFSLGSYEVACFLCVRFTPVPMSLNPARAGDPPPTLSALSNRDRALDTEPGTRGATGAGKA